MLNNTNTLSNKDSGNKKDTKRLGRGLGSLLGGAASLDEAPTPAVVVETKAPVAAAAPSIPVPPESRVWQIAVEKLVPSQFQPRTHFNKEALEELAASVREKGIFQPIVARRLNSGSVEIIAGERRWRAAQMAGLHEVPVILKTLSNKETLELAIIENIQREDLNVIEEAEAYQRLMNEFQLTQAQAAERVGKDRTTVANALRLLGLPTPVREMLVAGQLTAGHAKVLLGLESPEKMTELAHLVLKQQLSVRALEKEISAVRTSAPATEASAPRAEEAKKAVAQLGQELQKLLGTRVSIDYNQGKGRISIAFYSDDELNSITDKVKAGCQK